MALLEFELFEFVAGKQFSLDSRMDLVVHGMDAGVRRPSTADDDDVKNRAITEDGEEAWEGTKGRYCSGHTQNDTKFRCCLVPSCVISVFSLQ